MFNKKFLLRFSIIIAVGIILVNSILGIYQKRKAILFQVEKRVEIKKIFK